MFPALPEPVAKWRPSLFDIKMILIASSAMIFSIICGNLKKGIKIHFEMLLHA